MTPSTARLNGRIVEAFRTQAGWCTALGSPFTAGLLSAASRSLANGGPLSALIDDWPGDPIADALPLRVAGALHEIALDGAQRALSAAYPRPETPGRPDAAWSAAEAVIAADPEGFRSRLEHPPQTNETRRALGLFPGLMVVAERFGRAFDLFELGASAGLNLHMDRFDYRTPVWSRSGGSGVAVEGDWRGPPPPLDASVEIRRRAGCDRNPLAPGDPNHRRRLRSYVWADQFERLARLEAALDLAASSGATVDAGNAEPWVRERLREARSERAPTVIFHSVVWQYLQPDSRARIALAIEAAGAEASDQAPLAWLRSEPRELLEGGTKTNDHIVDLITWPGGRRRILAEIDPHGRWVDWKG